jgi:hypothetical protein
VAKGVLPCPPSAAAVAKSTQAAPLFTMDAL